VSGIIGKIIDLTPRHLHLHSLVLRYGTTFGQLPSTTFDGVHQIHKKVEGLL
jgi:hypothetical protein